MDSKVSQRGAFPESYDIVHAYFVRLATTGVTCVNV